MTQSTTAETLTTTPEELATLAECQKATDLANWHQDEIKRLHNVRLDLLWKLHQQGMGVNAIARALGKDKSTVSPLMAQARKRHGAS